VGEGKTLEKGGGGGVGKMLEGGIGGGGNRPYYQKICHATCAKVGAGQLTGTEVKTKKRRPQLRKGGGSPSGTDGDNKVLSRRQQRSANGGKDRLALKRTKEGGEEAALKQGSVETETDLKKERSIPIISLGGSEHRAVGGTKKENFQTGLCKRENQRGEGNTN